MRKIAPRTRLAFAASGIPTSGIIVNGIDYFLFFFYSQIIGLSFALTGLALAIALTFDAVSDPLIGYVSDNWKSRWGRRHPFMYASIVPASVLYVMIWHPPGDPASQWILFAYLLAVSILLRISMTMFDMPVQTLVAELTPDYDERTRLASLPITVAWVTSSIMAFAMYAIWLKDTAEHVNGQMNRAGYQDAALVCGAVVLAALIFTCVGLHPEIPNLHQRTARQAPGLRDMFRSMGELLQNRSMRALLLAGLFLSAGVGTNAALYMYHYGAFFGMSSQQMSVLLVVQLVATFAVIPVVRKVVVKGDKKVMAMRFLGASVGFSAILPPLHALGLLPARGSEGLLHILMVYDFVSQIIWIVAVAIIYSLYADVTDDLLLKVGKRMEGVIFSGQTFIAKSATALGALLAGWLLTAIRFPAVSDAALAPDSALIRLGLSYMGSWVVLGSIGIWQISKYEITRSKHVAEVTALEEGPEGTAAEEILTF